MKPRDIHPQRPLRTPFREERPVRDAYEAAEERMSGEVLDRYYYYGEVDRPPKMRQSKNRHYFDRRPHVRSIQYGDYETSHANPVRYDYLASNYNSEYDAVSDVYSAYLENQDFDAYRREKAFYDSRRIPPYDSYYQPQPSVSSPLGRANREEHSGHSFHFSEQVIEKIAAQAVYEVEGVLALSANMSDNLFERFGGRTAQAEIVDNGVKLDLYVVMAYGVNGRQLFSALAENISSQIRSMTGMDVDSIHIEVVDIMPREEFNARYTSQAPELQARQIAAHEQNEPDRDDNE